MPGLRMHLTVDRVRAIVRTAFETCGCARDQTWADAADEELIQEAIDAARAITYDPSTRGALGGFAKARAHPARNGASAADKARRREKRAEEEPKRRAARLAALLEEESRIGTTRITR